MWSPDGSKIAFVSDRDGNDEIYVMNADGSNQTRLTNNTVTDISPVWSPEDSSISRKTVAPIVDSLKNVQRQDYLSCQNAVSV